jgi:hypothetical protein
MAKTATLTSGLVAKKGEATPAVTRDPIIATVPKTPPASNVDYYKALTVKLDRERYESLKTMGLKLDKKSQEIFVEALDMWLKQKQT